MPELPEVETVMRGIIPHLVNQHIADVVIRQKQLRWPIPPYLAKNLQGQMINHISRRGKYLLLNTQKGTVIIHLGMSGHLRVLSKPEEPNKHDHVDLILDNGCLMRFNDPRRFGTILWTSDDPLLHPLLSELGPEPLSEDFNGGYLFQRAQRRHIAIKQFIMDGRIVVGVGNIYANEALFIAKIHPLTSAGKISFKQYKILVAAIKKILSAAIESGGSTIRDFLNSSGKPGYFVQHLQVYGRDGMPCNKCRSLLEEIRISDRSSVFCPNCQIRF